MRTADDIIAELRSLADPANAAGMVRYGISPEGILGVKVPVLRDIAKQLRPERKIDPQGLHALAADLWASGVHEARILAAFVDVPALVTPEQADAWLLDVDSWDTCRPAVRQPLRPRAVRLGQGAGVGGPRRDVREAGRIRDDGGPGAARPHRPRRPVPALPHASSSARRTTSATSSRRPSTGRCGRSGSAIRRPQRRGDRGRDAIERERLEGGPLGRRPTRLRELRPSARRPRRSVGAVPHDRRAPTPRPSSPRSPRSSCGRARSPASRSWSAPAAATDAGQAALLRFLVASTTMAVVAHDHAHASAATRGPAAHLRSPRSSASPSTTSASRSARRRSPPGRPRSSSHRVRSGPRCSRSRFLGERLNGWGWVGVALAFSGVSAIAFGEGKGGFSLEPMALLVLLRVGLDGDLLRAVEEAAAHVLVARVHELRDLVRHRARCSCSCRGCCRQVPLRARVLDVDDRVPRRLPRRARLLPVELRARAHARLHDRELPVRAAGARHVRRMGVAGRRAERGDAGRRRRRACSASSSCRRRDDRRTVTTVDRRDDARSSGRRSANSSTSSSTGSWRSSTSTARTTTRSSRTSTRWYGASARPRAPRHRRRGAGGLRGLPRVRRRRGRDAPHVRPAGVPSARHRSAPAARGHSGGRCARLRTRAVRDLAASSRARSSCTSPRDSCRSRSTARSSPRRSSHSAGSL